jgi:hypothetical protein
MTSSFCILRQSAANGSYASIEQKRDTAEQVSAPYLVYFTIKGSIRQSQD